MFDTLKRMQKKILIIDKKIQTIQKILIIFKDSRQMRIFLQKVSEFCSKLSCNFKTFYELGSQDPPIFNCLTCNWGLAWAQPVCTNVPPPVRLMKLEETK